MATWWSFFGNPRRGGILVAIVLALAVVVGRDRLARLKGPTPASLADILLNTESYVGQQVEVTGSIRAFDDSTGRYYVLEDASQNRILLLTDPRQLQSRVGTKVTAIGTIGFSDDQGISLAVQSLGVPSG